MHRATGPSVKKAVIRILLGRLLRNLVFDYPENSPDRIVSMAIPVLLLEQAIWRAPVLKPELLNGP